MHRFGRCSDRIRAVNPPIRQLDNSHRPPSFDCVVIGAGAAGLFCAAMAGRAGVQVLLVDHSEKLAEKIRISGGGRCNFTNRDTTHDQFLSSNPRFCRSALARYTPADFLALLKRHGIAWHEKHKGQLFCDESSEQIIEMLKLECDEGRVTRWQPCAVDAVEQTGAAAPDGFILQTDRGPLHCKRLVIATGGLSIPKIGATDYGYRVARQFGHNIVQTTPALVPLTFDPVQWAPFAGLAGLSLPVRIGTDAKPGTRSGAVLQSSQFAEDLLFTHRGLSGPAVLQISSYWNAGTDIAIDLSPQRRLDEALLQAKAQSKRLLSNELSTLLPSRLAETWLARFPHFASRSVADLPDRALREVAQSIHEWRLRPAGSEGYRKAEVTAGGVDTRELSSQTMESRIVPGLYFIGEVVDVTGWLGGYNFQWAWASGAACARALAQQVSEASLK